MRSGLRAEKGISRRCLLLERKAFQTLTIVGEVAKDAAFGGPGRRISCASGLRYRSCFLSEGSRVTPNFHDGASAHFYEGATTGFCYRAFHYGRGFKQRSQQRNGSMNDIKILPCKGKGEHVDPVYQRDQTDRGIFGMAAFL